MMPRSTQAAFYALFAITNERNPVHDPYTTISPLSILWKQKTSDERGSAVGTYKHLNPWAPG